MSQGLVTKPLLNSKQYVGVGPAPVYPVLKLLPPCSVLIFFWRLRLDRYMFVHDGLVHRRFPVGPIANVPYLKKIAMAHKLHHSEKFAGVPYGLFFAIEVNSLSVSHFLWRFFGKHP